jgi:chromosome segregation ATPase
VLSTDAQATVEALQRERDGLEAKCLEEHVTIEQADAKVMKLEGDKGMWANERRDLLTQLENAESQLSQLRALVREIKKEFDNCTHECERCGESDPLTTFDIYRTVAKAATLDAMTPARGQE